MSNFINLSLGCFSSDHIVIRNGQQSDGFLQNFGLLMPPSECLQEVPMSETQNERATAHIMSNKFICDEKSDIILPSTNMVAANEHTARLTHNYNL